MSEFEHHHAEQESEEKNKKAWNDCAYEAWIHKFGTPIEAAAKIEKDPKKSLSVLNEYFGEVTEKKIANVMGSNGTKAVALAKLGAEVTIFDYGEGNQRYAMELAKAAGVSISYVLKDVLKLSKEDTTGNFDIAFAEIGILHYFLDLHEFFQIVSDMLKAGGTFILRDFHPVSNKLISSRGTTAKIRKHKVDGDYFSTELVESEISYAKYLEDLPTKKVYLRKWNLGEIITAVADCGFMVKSLNEEPNLSCDSYDKEIPKTFTLVAKKMS